MPIAFATCVCDLICHHTLTTDRMKQKETKKNVIHIPHVRQDLEFSFPFVCFIGK